MKNLALALLLGLLGALLYAPTAKHGFVYDDEDYVVENPILDEGLSVAGIRRSFVEAHSANWHPLTWLTHLLDRTWFGLEPAGHHIVNVLWFTASAALLFLALVALTQRRWPSFFIALFFVVHPLRVESVAWVAERKDVVSGFFFALCLLAYARFAKTGRWIDSVAVAGALAAGLLAKPMLVTLPCVLLLLDHWPLDRFKPLKSGVERTGFGLLREKLPLFVLVAGASVLTVWAQRKFGALSSVATVSLPLRLLNSLDAYGFYLQKTFWPSGLACIYPHPALVEADPIGAIALRSSLWGGVLLLVSVLAVRSRKRSAYFTVGWFWFLGMLVPVIGWVSVGAQAYADRYAYLPTLGLYIALVFAADDFLRSRSAGPTKALRNLLVGAAVTASLALALVTTRQLRTWKDGESLYTRALEIRERSHVAHNNLGQVLMGQERYEEALQHLQAAVEIRPNFLFPQLNLAQLMRDTGRPQVALQHIQRALAIEPESARAHAYHGLLQRDLGQLPLALQAVDRSLAIDPDDTEQLFNRGVILAKLARFAEAQQAYEQLLEHEPEFADALVNLGNLHLRAGAPESAVAYLRRAVRSAPELAPAQAALGLAYLGTGDTALAVEHLQRALRYAPDLLEVARKLAWILVTTSDDTLRNPREGLRLIRLCVQALAEGQAIPPGLQEILAAALAANGAFDEALRVQEAALQRLPEMRRAAGRKRLLSYRSGRALREP